MEEQRNTSPAEYVFVQTVVVRSARKAHWLERALGRGEVQEIHLAGRPLPPRLQGSAPVAARPRVAQGSVDLWINTLAVVTLGVFLLSLYLFR